MEIREAQDGDIPAITAIYNHAVTQTVAIFNESCASPEDRRAWMMARQDAGWPVLVAQDAAGTVTGFASFGPWRPHEGYRHTVEHSLYVAPDRQGAGIGRALLDALIARARLMGKHAMIAGIESGNAASIALHEQRGFVRVGLLPEVAMKFGRWLDLAFLQLRLDERPTPDPAAPPPPKGR